VTAGQTPSPSGWQRLGPDTIYHGLRAPDNGTVTHPTQHGGIPSSTAPVVRPVAPPQQAAPCSAHPAAPLAAAPRGRVQYSRGRCAVQTLTVHTRGCACSAAQPEKTRKAACTDSVAGYLQAEGHALPINHRIVRVTGPLCGIIHGEADAWIRPPSRHRPDSSLHHRRHSAMRYLQCCINARVGNLQCCIIMECGARW
jgi:hypothetical protein